MKKILFSLFILLLAATLASAQVIPGPRSVSVPGTLLTSSTTSTGTGADLTEDTLWTWPMPANTLDADGKAIRITAFGSLAANANSKTIKAYFGATVVANVVTTASGNGFRVVAEVVRSGATAQKAFAQTVLGAFTNAGNISSSPAETLSGAITIKVTGTNGTASANDIVLTGALVEIVQTTNGLTVGTGGGIANPLLEVDGTTSAPSYSFASETGLGMFRITAGEFGIANGNISGLNPMSFKPSSLTLGSAISLGWGSTTAASASVPDTTLFRDAAADTLALRRSTNPQTFRLYNTFTDAANYERLSIFGAVGGPITFDSQAAGTGTARNLLFSTSGSSGLQIQQGGNVLVYRNFLFGTDNTNDIGASGANRPRNYFGAGIIRTAQDIQAGAAFTIQWAGRSQMQSPADGNIELTDSAAATFGLLQFGGTTASFPALKRTGTVLEAKLSDDSAYTSFNAGVITATSNLTNNAGQITAGVGTGITVNDGGSVRRLAYKVTIASTAFQCAALTCDVTVGTLPAKTVLLGAYADMTTTFACASTCTTATLTASLGDSTGAQGVMLNWDADAAIATKGLADADLGASLARATAVQGGKVYSFASTTAIFIRLTSGTGNIGTGAATNFSQGSITVYLVTERLP